MSLLDGFTDLSTLNLFNLCSFQWVMIPTRLLLALSLFIIHGCLAWDQQELGMYDLIEEVNQNFYELFGIEPVSSDIYNFDRKIHIQ